MLILLLSILKNNGFNNFIIDYMEDKVRINTYCKISDNHISLNLIYSDPPDLDLQAAIMLDINNKIIIDKNDLNLSTFYDTFYNALLYSQEVY